MDADEVARLSHIPDAEVRKDIYDTEAEIFDLERRISERKKFIAKLEALLEQRRMTT
jgi:hypothetical protein